MNPKPQTLNRYTLNPKVPLKPESLEDLSKFGV